MKKRITSFLTAAFLCFGLCAFAENAESTAQPSEAPYTAGDTAYIADETPEPADESVPEEDAAAFIEETDPVDSASEENSTNEPTTGTSEAAKTDTAMASAPSEPIFTGGGDIPGITAPSADTDPMDIANTVDVIIDMEKHPLVVDSFVTVELYTTEDILLDTQSEWVGGITEKVVLHFSTPDYVLGQSFKLRFVGGLNWLQFYDTTYYPGGVFYIQTYSYTDDSGQHITGNTFTMTGDPQYTRSVVVYNEYGMMDLAPDARLIDGVTYVPVRQVAESLGLNVRYDGYYNSVAVSIGDRVVAYNIGSPITNYFGEDRMMNGSTRSIDGYVFVPVRSLADAFETGIQVLDFVDHFDVILGKSQVVQNYYDSFYVNQMGIGSKTNYLIWVSKSEYKVRAYRGQQYTWTPIAEFTCAIGAPETPTITGQFDYFSRETAWDYGTYYVGPIMRFYNGYALHSTLLYYGGGEYDGRVGVQISHGCVRLHPDDINWLVDNIPLYSRVWVTE